MAGAADVLGINPSDYAAPVLHGYSVVEPHPAPDNPDVTTNLSDEDYAKFKAGIASPTRMQDHEGRAGFALGMTDVSSYPSTPAPPAHGSGIIANIGAGTGDATAGALGFPVDLATGAINLGLRGAHTASGAINQLLGIQSPPTEAPQITNPIGGSESIKSAFGLIPGADPRGIQAVTPAERIARAAGSGAASMLIPWAGARALPVLAGVPGVIQKVIGGGRTPPVTTGAVAGGAGQAAEDMVPDPWKPLANFGGQMVGGGLTAATGAGLKNVAGMARPIVSGFTRPLTKAGQEGLAAHQIESAASDIGTAREALDNPRPELVPGSQPTTYQMTGDQGLGNLERGVAKESPDLFLARSAQQNMARVAAVPGKNAGSAQAVGTAFRAHLADIDALGQKVTNLARERAQGATEAMGGAVPAGADAQTTALQSYGQTLRSGLDAANEAARAHVSRLYDAVDPDGTLRVGMGDIKAAARRIVADMPKNAAPMEGDASKIFGVAQMQPGVQSFREVAALRSRLTDAMREELYDNGRSQTYRRMSQLLAAVDDTLSKGVEEGGATVADRIAAFGKEDAGEPATGATGGPGNAAGAGAPSGGVPGAGGSESQGIGRPGSAGGNSAVATAEAGRGRKPESVADFLIARGGVTDPSGDLRAVGADAIHHRAGGRLINPRGLSPDYARELLEGEGFLRPNSTIADYYNLVGEQAAGRPAYRLSEQAEGDAYNRAVREGARTDAAYNAAKDQVFAANGGRTRLTPEEMDHAAHMVMQGEHPEQAVMEAVRAREEGALQTNAQVSAFGRPGVPSGAAQASMDTEGTAGEAANFTPDRAAAYRAANAAHAERVGTFEEAPGVGSVLATGKRKGEWRLGDSQVASTIFNSGKGAAERVQAFLKAGGDSAALSGDIQDYAAFSLRRAAEGPDGTLDPAKFKRWMDAHREALAAFPELTTKFETAAAARTTMDESAAAYLTVRTEYEKSAASHFLGDADPVARMGKILRSDTADATLRELAQLTAKDPAAREGLRQATADYILQELRSNALSGSTTERAFKVDVFQTFVRKALPAMRHIFEPEELEMIQNIATDMQQSQRSVISTKLPGGSNTAQDLAAGAHHRPSLVGMLAAMEAAGELAGHAGSVVGGPLGNLVGKVGGMIGIPIIQAMRQAGLKNVDALVTQAMLHPEVARALLAKLPPGDFAKPVVNNAARQIRALAANAAVTSSRRQGESK